MKPFLDILKKHWVSIMWGVVALAAVIAVFFPLSSKFTELQAKVDSRKQEYSTLEGLLDKQRSLPIVNPSETTAKKLEMFPTDAAITRAKNVVDAISGQSAGVLEIAQKLNEHTLLVPGSLPAGQTGFAFDYQAAYQKQVEFLSADESIRSQTLPVKLLHAGTPPSEAEIAEAKLAAAKEIADEKLIPGPNGNQAAVDNEIEQMKATLGQEMKQAVATKSKIYINADSLDVYPGVYNTAQPPVAAVIYYSQVGLWVQQDVFQAIADTNANATNVTDAPIKHLIKIDVSEDGHTGAPGSPANNPPAAGTTVLAPTLTGRTSNTLYDVIPFHLTLYVDAQKLPAVLTELTRNRFITILRCDVIGVDSTTALLNGFFYGNVPVVQISLDCEALFLKSWLSKFAPPSIAPVAPAAG